jgi:hypothetical protein
MIAAHPHRASPEVLRIFLNRLTEFVRAFDSSEKRAKDNVEFIKEKFGYPEEDIKVSILSACVGFYLLAALLGVAFNSRVPS